MLSINQDGTVRVNYVDYGNSEDVHVTMLRKLNQNLRRTPIQVHVTLQYDFNAKPINEIHI